MRQIKNYSFYLYNSTDLYKYFYIYLQYYLASFKVTIKLIDIMVVQYK
jgi:hypothetical protein